MVKTIIMMAFALFSFSISAFAQSQEKTLILSTEQICKQFQELSKSFTTNYIIGGYTKEQQLKYMRERVYPKYPYIEGFEPGMIKILNALMVLRHDMDNLEQNQYDLVINGIGSSTYKICMLDGANGWVQQTENVIPLRPENGANI